MPRPQAPRNTADSRPASPASAGDDTAPVPQRKGWPFAQGSQNHLDETAAPWPRPASKPAPGKTPDAKRDQ